MSKISRNRITNHEINEDSSVESNVSEVKTAEIVESVIVNEPIKIQDPPKVKITKFKKFKRKYTSFKIYLNSNKKVIRAFSIGMTLFIVAAAFMANMQVGYAVIYNNETIGYVTERDATKSEINKISEDLASYNDPKYIVNLNTAFNPSFVPASKITDEDEIASKIKYSLGFYVDGCILMIDDVPKFALKSEADANKVLETYQNLNKGEGEVVSVEFKNNVTYKLEKVLYSQVLTIEDAVATLAGTNSKEGMYTVQQGDTLWGIGIANDMPTDYIMSLNNLESETIVIGQKLRVKSPNPLLNVVVKKKISYVEYQPNETKYEYDKSMTKDTKKTVQEGRNGETKIEALVTLENLQETDREIISQEIISKPEDTIIMVGTKPKPTTAPTGKFMRPVGGYISSPFGIRSRGNHTGVDYAVSFGTQVVASDGGTIIAAGWGGGYGNMVKIDHGNGYETLYAHSSKLAVKVGQKVAKGQVICYVGSTGNSTGPHLHFEIRKNGTYVNPESYY